MSEDSVRPSTSAAYPRLATLDSLHDAAIGSARLHDYAAQTFKTHWGEIKVHEKEIEVLKADMQVQKSEALTTGKLARMLGLFSVLIVILSWIANHVHP